MESSRYSLDSTTTFAASPTSPSTTLVNPKLHCEGLGLLHSWDKTSRSPTTAIRIWRDDTTQEDQKPARRSRALVVKIYLLACFTILICTCAAWGIVAYTKSSTAAQCVSHAAGGKDNILHLASDINGLVPEFPLRRQTFQPDPPSTNTTNLSSLWSSSFPLGNGFITVPPPTTTNTNPHLPPPPMQYNNQQVYSVAVFHQIHCLQMIMTGYNSLASGEVKGGHTDHKHINHCFGYLRQSLMCCGDAALEGQNPETEGEKVETSGMGVVHLCKDYRGIVEWVEERRVSDEKGV